MHKSKVAWQGASSWWHYLIIILNLGEEAPLITPYQNTHFPTELGVGKLDDPTKSEGILITWGGKKKICAVQVPTQAWHKSVYLLTPSDTVQ